MRGPRAGLSGPIAAGTGAALSPTGRRLGLRCAVGRSAKGGLKCLQPGGPPFLHLGAKAVRAWLSG